MSHNALVLIDRSDIPLDVTFSRFFLFLKLKFLPDHSFERMSARLCAMEITPHPPDAETAYAATGDHHLFLLTVIAAAIQGGFKYKVEFMRYDVPAAFLQRLLPTPCYGRLPPDLPEPYGNSFVAVSETTTKSYLSSYLAGNPILSINRPTQLTSAHPTRTSSAGMIILNLIAPSIRHLPALPILQ